ncbi:hypothetical protein ACJRO7_018548 [Eucalyptus globulus]|uniref:Uncharacterized protein n=1 Tax=Eucalyptus globulus TaxID=34317 RepID=A0ABD3KVJ6_EUCGL
MANVKRSRESNPRKIGVKHLQIIIWQENKNKEAHTYSNMRGQRRSHRNGEGSATDVGEESGAGGLKSSRSLNASWADTMARPTIKAKTRRDLTLVRKTTTTVRRERAARVSQSKKAQPRKTRGWSAGWKA